MAMKAMKSATKTMATKAMKAIQWKEYYQKNKARIVTKRKEYYQKIKARIAAYYAANSGRLKEYHGRYSEIYRRKGEQMAGTVAVGQGETNTNPSTARKEYKRKYDASPHGKAKQKEYNAKRQKEDNDKRYTTPHRMATLHGKGTTSGRGRATSLPEAQAVRRNVVRGVCSGNPGQGNPTGSERRWGQQADASQLCTACSALWDTAGRCCLALHMWSLQCGP